MEEGEVIMAKVQVRTVGAFIVGESVTETALAGGTVIEISVQGIKVSHPQKVI